MNVHFHVLALDGVYVRDESSDNPSGRLRFHALCTPTRAEVAAVAGRTAARIEKILKKAGRSLDPEMQDAVPPELCNEEPGLGACYAAAAQGVSVAGERAGLPPPRLLVSVDPKLPTDDPSDPAAEISPRQVLRSALEPLASAQRSRSAFGARSESASPSARSG